MAMFAGGGMPMAAPGMMAPQAAAAPAAAPAPAPAVDEAPAADVESESKPKEEAKKGFVAERLLGFETPKKIQVVKEVRTITALGLKEAKDLAEGSPKILKKGVPVAEAEAMRDKLVAAGAQVAIE